MATGTVLDERIDWPGALALLALAFLPELLPIVFGTGEHATWDWAFIYVTCHFVLLPLATIFVLIASVAFLIRGPAATRKRAVFPALVSAGLLTLMLNPFPGLRGFSH
jgi:hypothetical protein